MAKVRGDSLYTERGDDLFEKGQGNYPNADKIDKFVSEVLDKTFDNWILAARDVDPTSFKEVEGGNLLNGVVFYNVKGTPSKLVKEREGKSSIKHLNRKGQIAMMLLDVIEGMCEDEEEAENSLDALLETAKHLHKHKDDDSLSETDSKEEALEAAKIKVLKGLLETSIESFETFDGKVKFLKSCIGSVLPARVFESGSSALKDKLRESMKASIAGDKDGTAFALGSVDAMTHLVDVVLDAMDEGKNAEEIAKAMRDFGDTLGVDKTKFKVDFD